MAEWKMGQLAPTSNSQGQSEEMEWVRATTHKGQKGWVAWIDGPTRLIHCQEGQCVGFDNGMPEIALDDQSATLTVPHGRLDCTPNKSLDALAFDLRIISEGHMKPIQAELAAIARTLLLDLVAIEMAKKKSGEKSDRDNLEDGIKKIGHH